MAQRRFWNYKDDDSTFDLNFRELGIFEAGRYRGFDPLLAAGLTLELNHLATGVDKTQLDGVTVTRYGLWNSKQGVIVTEDTAINLTIAAGDPTDPRIDLIVGQHQYIATTGGAVAIYLVIQGTPAPNPVAPALTLPDLQVELGRLYVPAGMTDLNGTGVVYTQALVPDYSGDDTVAHTDRTNDFQALQIFEGFEQYAGVAFLDTGASSTAIELQDTSGNADNIRNFYFLSTTTTPTGNYNVLSISNVPTPQTDNVQQFTIYNGTTVSLRFAGAAFARDYYIKANSAVTFAVNNSGQLYAVEADEAGLGSINRFYKQNIWNWDTGTTAVFNLGLLTLTQNHNFYNLGNNVGDTLRGISATSAFDSASTNGGFIVILPENNLLPIEPFDFSVPAGYKPIATPWIPTSPSHPRYSVKNSGLMIFVEDLFTWRLVDPQQEWVDLPFSFTVSGAGTVTQVGTPEFKAMIINNTVHVKFSGTFDFSGLANSSAINFPIPFTIAGASSGIAAFVSASSGALPYATLTVQTTPTTLRVYEASNGFNNRTSGILKFTGIFELDF